MLSCYALKFPQYNFSDYTVKYLYLFYYPVECSLIALIFFSLFLVNCSHKLEYIKLKKWLKERGFEDSNLRPAEFWGKAFFVYWWYKAESSKNFRFLLFFLNYVPFWHQEKKNQLLILFQGFLECQFNIKKLVWRPEKAKIWSVNKTVFWNLSLFYNLFIFLSPSKFSRELRFT